MNKHLFGLANLLILVAIMCNGISSANAAEQLVNLKQLPQQHLKTTAARKPITVPKPPKVKAKAYILVDADSGKVIAEKNAQERRPPASLTKMLTMYVVSEALKEERLKLQDEVLISKNAWRTGGSRMFVKVGEKVKVEELLKGIIVQSGNDACVALAEHMAGNEVAFSDMMNHTAKQLGMSDSHFTDSTGMPHENHYTTARDIAILARALVHHYPEYYGWYKQKWFTHNNIRQPNRNRLLWRNPYVDGIKTGHTEEAGYCLASSAKKENMRLIAVVMGAPTDEARAAASQALLNYGFRYYETHKLYAGEQILERPRVWRGEKTNVPVGLAHDLVVTIPTGQYKNLEAILEVQKNLRAPLNRGQQIGELQLKLNGEIFMTRPLVALAANQRGGIWRRKSIKLYSTHCPGP